MINHKGMTSLQAQFCLLGLLLSGRPSEIVEVNVEPVVHFAVKGVVFIADLLRRQTFLQSFRLCRSSVFVRATHVQDVVVAQSTKPKQK